MEGILSESYMTRCLISCLVALNGTVTGSPAGELDAGSTPAEVKNFFDQRGKTVITFVGYSGAGYEDVYRMLEGAQRVLAVHSPKKAIVNIGATSEGIGAVYDLAKEMGFDTTGIVSTQAREYQANISPHVDKVFFVADVSWGGFLDDSETLSPTSRAMVDCSDIVIGIGGGEVSRDEMIAARREGKTVLYIAADMNHKTAIEKARKKGLPDPTDFRGAAFAVFGKPSDSDLPSGSRRFDCPPFLGPISSFRYCR